jgi:hypothetical protein
MRKLSCLPHPASRQEAPPSAFTRTRRNDAEGTLQMSVSVATGKSSCGASSEVIVKSLQLTRKQRYIILIIAISNKSNKKHKQIMKENRELLNVNNDGIFMANI